MKIILSIFLILISISLISAFEISEFDFDYPPVQFDNNTAFVNRSTFANHSLTTDSWITGLGQLDDVNGTQFSNNGGTLNALKSWWDGLYCQLTGCTMAGDIDGGDNHLFNFNNVMELKEISITSTIVMQLIIYLVH